MAITVRRLDPAATIALATAHNLSCANTIVVGGSLFHADKTSLTTTDQFISTSAAVLQVTAAAATDLTSCITLMNNISGVLRVHLPDGISTDPYACGAHKIPDTTNLASVPAVYVSAGNATADLAACVAGANADKALINLHFAQAGVHFNNDGTNTIVAAAATVLGDTITLLNACRTALNAHINSGPSTMIKIVNA